MPFAVARRRPRPDWNGVTAPAPIRATARPGVARLMVAASLTSTTSADSPSSVTRNAIRRVVFARMSALTTPLGRWVASTRCTPSERPRCAIPTRPPTKSGSSSASVANSSTTRTSRGNDGSPADRCAR
jgi:hypothetical protein